MTFNPAMSKTVVRIREHLPESPSVIELGSQTLTVSFKDKPEVETVEDFYRELGFAKYDSIDANNKGTVFINLNYSLETDCPRYDLVTNNGTGEHIFNQYAIFHNMHHLCKAGGYMIHVLPWINWQNHGFYNFNPVLFDDLARANRYHRVMTVACDRDGGNMFEPGFEEIKEPEPTGVNFFIISVLQKKYDSTFCMPMQAKYDPPVDPLSLKDGFIWPEKVETHPFPHFVSSLEGELYEQLESEWPRTYDFFSGWGKNKKGDSNVLEQYSAGKALFEHALTPLWKAFMEYTTSGHFFQEVIRTFSPHIQGMYPITQLPLETGIRGLDDKPFLLDSQLAVNTPVSHRSSVRGPHVDDPRELFAGLLYMPSQGYDSGGNLEFYEWKGKRTFRGRKGMVKKTECPKKAVRKVRTIEYSPNTLVFFLNSPDAIHAVSPRDVTDQHRRYVNMLAQTDKPLFEAK
jgi:hypothetical protein